MGGIGNENKAFAEGSPLQYSWALDWNISRMLSLRGGPTHFACELDDFFEDAHKARGAPPDMSGNIGGASFGNEPVMHTPYLYSLIGFPSRTQYMVNKIVTQLFSSKVDGLPGNDDLGQMSSWLAFSMLGLYPVDPCSKEHVFGRPFVDSADIQVAGGALKIKVNNQSDENVFVKSIYWNGKPIDLTRPTISLHNLTQGGFLEFTMVNRATDPRYVCPDRIDG